MHNDGVMKCAGRAVFAVNAGVSAALFGVGYIVGWKIALVFLLGGISNWLIALPMGTGAGWIHQVSWLTHNT